MVRAWGRSGQSARAYAAIIGVSAASLLRWRSIQSNAERPRLVDVVAAEPDSSSGWEVELPAGTLRVRGALDARTAKAIVEALASAKPR